jgi:HK97 family phage major capsid protein
MKSTQSYLRAHGPQLFVAVLICGALAFGMIDPASAMIGGIMLDTAPTDLKALHEATEKAFKAMTENIAKVQDMAMKALETSRTEGTITTEQNAKLKELGEAGKAISDQIAELKMRTLEVEQKLAHRPVTGTEDLRKSLGQIVAESEEFKAACAQKNARSMGPVTVGSFHKTNIVNATLNTLQPLVDGLRLPGIVGPGLRRLTIRDLMPQTPTGSNLIEFARELVFTNAAAPQGAVSSPDTTTEGASKAESAITFELATTPVITLAHFIPASRQVLSDAPMLQGYVDGRLRYGLALEEENELLNGNGLQGTLQGLAGQSAAFTGGATNQTALDTLLKADLQVSLSNFSTTGFILHPTDWINILLLKDNTQRYLFSDPHGMQAPRIWGKDVVPTQSQTAGQFLAGAFNLAAEIFDREDATVRVAEQHSDFFIRNLVAILAEERLALAVYRQAALVHGAISYAG